MSAVSITMSSEVMIPTRPVRKRRLPWHGLWQTLVVAAVITYAWPDLLDIAAGTLYLTAHTIQRTNPERALELLDYAEWLAPDAAYVHSKRGYLQMQQGQTESAQEGFEKALLFDERNAAALNNLARLRFDEGEPERAARLEDLAAIYAPNNATVHHNHGLLLFSAGDFVAASRAFAETTRIQPGNMAAHLYLSLSYLQQGQLDKAEFAARQSLLLNAREPSAHLALLYALYDQNRLVDALASTDEAAPIFPDDVRFSLFKALLLHDMGDNASARAILEPIAASTSDERLVRVAAEMLNMVQ